MIVLSGFRKNRNFSYGYFLARPVGYNLKNNLYLLSSHGVYGASSWRPVTLTAVAGGGSGDDDGEEEGATAAYLAMEAGKGSECLTMAPYKPYSAIILQLDRPHVFSVLRHLARRFWNQTFHSKTDPHYFKVVLQRTFYLNRRMTYVHALEKL